VQVCERAIFLIKGALLISNQRIDGKGDRNHGRCANSKDGPNGARVHLVGFGRFDGMAFSFAHGFSLDVLEGE